MESPERKTAPFLDVLSKSSGTKSFLFERVLIALTGYFFLIFILMPGTQFARPAGPPRLLREGFPVLLIVSIVVGAICVAARMSLASRIHAGLLLSCGLVILVYGDQKLGASVLGVSGDDLSGSIVLLWLSLLVIHTALFVGITHGLTRMVARVRRKPDPGKCRKCGYDLRGLSKPRCPECGTPFDPAVVTGAVDASGTLHMDVSVKQHGDKGEV